MITATFNAEVAINTLNAATTRIQQSPAIMATLHKRSMGRLTRRYITVLRTEPPLPRPGVTKRMTPRQRRAFWATNGFGHGIPYVRTHTMSKSWQAEIESINSGGIVSLFNEAPNINFVEGLNQQPFLEFVGWLYAPTILEKFVQDAAEITEVNWVTASDPFAGVPT